ncbi:MAG: hypothetical protein O2894_04215 [Planctomycetota bacterium]|nr:hypothetical protein [Planctomycetota bacterium]
MTHRTRLTLTLGALASALLLTTAPARADEILVRDLQTGVESTVRCFSISSETWTEIKYRERERSADKSIPTVTVVRIDHADKTPTALGVASALSELERGNFAEAARALKELSGGGWKIDFDTGERKGYQSFTENDPAGKSKRPGWESEYAHFYYAKALLLKAKAGQDKAGQDKAGFEDALFAVDDVQVPGGDGKQTTGGFLGRFEGGNSRFFPEATWIKAHALAGLGRFDEAQATFTQLQNDASRVKLDPRWTYEGVIGAGVIAEAKNDLTAAADGYRAAMPTMEVLLEQETRDYMRRQCGRWWSQAHMHVARIKLKDAEDAKSAAKFSALRAWIAKGAPDEVRAYAKGKNWPQPAIDALVAGARDPAAQAVGLNGIGLAYLNEPKPRNEEALLAFKTVTVQYFQVPAQHARALYYLAQVAGAAAKEAAGKKDVKAMYETMADEAIKTLREQYPDSEWARR